MFYGDHVKLKDAATEIWVFYKTCMFFPRKVGSDKGPHPRRQGQCYFRESRTVPAYLSSFNKHLANVYTVIYFYL